MKFVYFIPIFMAMAIAQDYEEAQFNDDYGAIIEAGKTAVATGNSKNQGFSAGSGLRSIAEGSFNSANDAFNNQDAAGHQAAFVAKNTLAQAAAGASATAQAALAGKQILLQGLEQQYRDAQQGLVGEKAQLMQAQRSAAASMQAAQEARAHVNVLTATLNAAQAAADHVTQAASEAAGELAAQQAMVGAAKQRVDALAEQLTGVRVDFEATRNAAQKAQAAAEAAAANAAATAAAAAANLAKSAKRTTAPKPSKDTSGGKGGKAAGGSGASDPNARKNGKFVQGIVEDDSYEGGYFRPYHFAN